MHHNFIVQLVNGLLGLQSFSVVLPVIVECVPGGQAVQTVPAASPPWDHVPGRHRWQSGPARPGRHTAGSRSQHERTINSVALLSTRQSLPCRPSTGERSTLFTLETMCLGGTSDRLGLQAQYRQQAHYKQQDKNEYTGYTGTKLMWPARQCTPVKHSGCV